jgi:PAS domain S-box-containing protein
MQRSAAATFSEEHYRELFTSIDQGFCVVEVLFDSHGEASDYRFLEVNAVFEEQTGLRDAVGHRMRELAPAHEEHWFQIYGQVARSGAPIRFEHQALALQRWFDVYAFRVDDPARRHVAILFNDVTARKAAEAALSAARQEAERANSTKDDFLAMLAHELRNLSAPMLTALQLMRLRGGATREVEVLERQTKHLVRMVDDLIDVSRITRGKIELRKAPVELCTVILRAMELAGPLLEQRQNHVEIHVPQRGASIDGDLDRLAQVLGNLLTNASKYSEPGSRIVIRAEREGAVVRTSVKDQGVGIPHDMLAAVFEPFVQQPGAPEHGARGLGLGLAIVRSLVTAHGGSVGVESEGVNKGSEFVFELPATDAVAEVVQGCPK